MPPPPGALIGELDDLLPQPGPRFAQAFVQAALRRNGRSWLGRSRIAALAEALRTPADAVQALLDRQPKPPPALGDAAFWTGRHVPLLLRGRIVWTELFWRPDRLQWHRGCGSFAFRLALPRAGRVEIRGRLEETRLDAVMHVESLSPQAALDAQELFCETLSRMRLEGNLTVRSTTLNSKT